MAALIANYDFILNPAYNTFSSTTQLASFPLCSTRSLTKLAAFKSWIWLSCFSKDHLCSSAMYCSLLKL